MSFICRRYGSNLFSPCSKTETGKLWVPMYSSMVLFAPLIPKKRFDFDEEGSDESEMEYPGQIKVNVIRETRSVEFAK